jgi:hypothetical protein
MITASAEQFLSLNKKLTKVFLVADVSGDERKMVVTGANAIEKIEKLVENTFYTFRFLSKTTDTKWVYMFGSSSMVRARP